MNQRINLGFFVSALVAGVALILGGHPELGAPLLAFAVGHVAPSPLNKTPSLERVENEENR